MLYIIRGLPGSGKSTLAEQLGRGCDHAADDFFYDTKGVYRFDAAKLGEAHADCQRRVRKALDITGYAAVANTFSRVWEIEPYIKIATELGTRYTILEVQTALTDEQLAARNVHGVPANVIKHMRARWEKFPTP